MTSERFGMYILERNGKYLSERYQWQMFPHAFPEWQFPAVLEAAMQYKDRPKRVGELVDGTLENAIWTAL